MRCVVREIFMPWIVEKIIISSQILNYFSLLPSSAFLYWIWTCTYNIYIYALTILTLVVVASAHLMRECTGLYYVHGIIPWPLPNQAIKPNQGIKPSELAWYNPVFFSVWELVFFNISCHFLSLGSIYRRRKFPAYTRIWTDKLPT